jgi:hypothetical protein
MSDKGIDVRMLVQHVPIMTYAPWEAGQRPQMGLPWNFLVDGPRILHETHPSIPPREDRQFARWNWVSFHFSDLERNDAHWARIVTHYPFLSEKYGPLP